MTNVFADGCFHGGAFFEEIGPSFDDLERRHRIINADVLDAWFPPAPTVLNALHEHLDWLARTSPPTHAEGLRASIAQCRGVPEASVAVGAGSSALIFLALRHWLGRGSRVLLLDPCYGEYAHVLERVIGCTVDRIALSPENGWKLDVDLLIRRLARGYDLFVLINPNNPTGQLLARPEITRIVETLSPRTRVWIDEAYLEYVDGDQTMESVAAASPNVFVCKSLSKVYALSGLRVAYLCGPRDDIRDLRALTPPWAVSLPAQVAAIRALQSPAYYAPLYQATRVLREDLTIRLRDLPHLSNLSGAANFVLCTFEPCAPTVSTILARTRRAGVFLRDVSNMGVRLGGESGPRVLRTAVKDNISNYAIVSALHHALDGRDAARLGAATHWSPLERASL